MTEFDGLLRTPLNGNGEVVPSRSSEKEEEYLLTFTFENLGQAMQQASDDSFTSRLIGHIPGAELIEIAMTFHNKSQSGVFIPLNGHLSMTGNLQLGSNNITGVGDITMTGELATVTNITQTGDLTGTDQFLGTAGAVGDPTYSFQTDPDSGQYSPTPGSLAWSINGTEEMRLNGTGLGLGTTPSYPLDIVATGVNGIRISRVVGNLEGLTIDSNTDTYISFQESGADRFTIGRDDTDNTFHLSTSAQPGSNTCLALSNTRLVGIRNVDFNAQLHVTQDSATGAIPVLELDQDDTDQPFIEFDGTSGANATDSLSSWTTGNSVQGHIQVTINGTKRWLQFFDDPTS